MIWAGDISSYHARAALEHHGDKTMICHLIRSAIRSHMDDGHDATWIMLTPAYHRCIKQYHINITSISWTPIPITRSIPAPFRIKSVSHHITKISSNLTCIVLRIRNGGIRPQKWGKWALHPGGVAPAHHRSPRFGKNEMCNSWFITVTTVTVIHWRRRIKRPIAANLRPDRKESDMW